MIKLSCKIPLKVSVAVSGGQDSMACLDFLRQGKRNLTVLHFNHATSHAGDAESCVRNYCEKWSIPILVGRLEGSPNKNQSMEDFWRKQRYEWFETVTNSEDKIITCHHLNDAIEWWVMTSLRGNPKLIPVQRDNFIRPFLLTPKEVLASWAERKGVTWVEDPSNGDVDYDRNYIRHTMMPHILRINPGIQKTLIKLIEANKSIMIQL